MQEKLKLSKSDGALTPAEKRRISNVPYASSIGLIMYVTTVKNILKYLWNTKDMLLVYGGDMKRELRVSCYTDAGYLMDADDLKSQTGYVFVLNRDAEYIVAFDASKEAVWIRKFIYGLNVVPIIKEPITMYCDNTGAIAIENDHGVTKEKVDTDDNLADPITKALAFPKHSELTRKIGLIPARSLIKIPWALSRIKQIMNGRSQKGNGIDDSCYYLDVYDFYNGIQSLNYLDDLGHLYPWLNAGNDPSRIPYLAGIFYRIYALVLDKEKKRGIVIIMGLVSLVIYTRVWRINLLRVFGITGLVLVPVYGSVRVFNIDDDHAVKF
ncbi:hypothetical protein Tco_0045169 [Tanacetum coccineum]